MKNLLLSFAFLAVSGFALSSFVKASGQPTEKINVLQSPTGNVVFMDPYHKCSNGNFDLQLTAGTGTPPAILRMHVNGVDTGINKTVGATFSLPVSTTTSVGFTFKSGGSTVLYASRLLVPADCN